MSLSVMLADDHEIDRGGLEACLRANPRFNVLSSTTLAGMRSALSQLVPDLLLIDPCDAGPEILQDAVRATSGRPRVVVVTGPQAPEREFAFVRAGALGYVLKSNNSPDLLFATLSAVGEYGVCFVVPEVAHRIHMRMGGDGLAGIEGRLTLFTPREAEIIPLLADGEGDQQIAHALSIHPSTVQSHVASIVRKLGATTRFHAGVILGSRTR